MATIREYYDTDSPPMSIGRHWDIDTGGQVLAKLAFNFDAGVRYWYLFVPKVEPLLEIVSSALATSEIYEGLLAFTNDGQGVDFIFGYSAESMTRSVNSLEYSRKVNLYVDSALTVQEIATIEKIGKKRRLNIEVRDTVYAENRSEMEAPVAFISHDSRDKDSLVRELAYSLRGIGCPVWYDEFSLSIGDNLRESIERGLREAHKCILVLSPNYLNNTGWSAKEFDAVFTREIVERQDVILPIWHNVDRDAVFSYSPTLANRYALNSSVGPAELAKAISAKVRTGDFYPRYFAN